jgi:uncharacterized SAM-binding protein YcdF (DUF218 family)
LVTIMALHEIVLPSGAVALLFLLGIIAVFARTAPGWLPLTGAGLLARFRQWAGTTLLMSPLEYAYPALDRQEYPDASVIVVLTGYAAEDANMPFSSLLNSSSAFRVIEAASLFAERPHSRIIVSGSQPAARIMAEQLRRFGVPPEKLTIDGQSPDTSDSAAAIAGLAGGEPLVLVTSAGHMKRAVGVFRKQGLEPIPAPTDYQLPRDVHAASWTPSALHLRESDYAIHEYLAMAWYELSGKT